MLVIKNDQISQTLDSLAAYFRTYRLSVADAMPEKNYAYSPPDDAMTSRELMQHTAYGID